MGLSTIQWCRYTFNPWIGCRFALLADGTFIEECFHCYAKLLDDNRYSKTLAPGTKEHPVSHWAGGPRHRTSEDNWKNPGRWNRKAIAFPWKCPACECVITNHAYEVDPSRLCSNCGNAPLIPNRPRVFSLSLGDWLDDEVPIEWTADMLRVIHDTRNLDWLLLTKRPQNWKPRLKAVMRRFENDAAFPTVESLPPEYHLAVNWACGDPPANVWIGVSAGADQAAALEIPARVHFLSCEPMLRALDTTHAARFDWIIFGGESGPKARPCNVDWILNGVVFCEMNGVAPFVKQLGSRPFQSVESAMGDLHPLKDKHGGDMAEWPEDLRVRCFPEVRA